MSRRPTASHLAARVAAAGDPAALDYRLAHKGVSTLVVRLSPLERREFWSDGHRVRPRPKDGEAWDSYMKTLRFGGAAPPSAKARRNARTLAHFVLRVRGAEMDRSMREHLQRPRLSVAQVRTLKWTGWSREFGPEDRIFAGDWCFVLACRARDADVQRASDEPLLDVPEGAEEGPIKAACVYTRWHTFSGGRGGFSRCWASPSPRTGAA